MTIAEAPPLPRRQREVAEEIKDILGSAIELDYEQFQKLELTPRVARDSGDIALRHSVESQEDGASRV